MDEKETKKESELENREWLQSLRWTLDRKPKERVKELLGLLLNEAGKHGVSVPFQRNTPYLNTIASTQETAYPGDLGIEENLTSLIRWNAMAMVVRANRKLKGIGGHISSYGSIANLWEVGFHHFFKIDDKGKADLVFFQGHASPGVYARAFLEGRLSEEHLENFRREITTKKALTSYPHPHLMPDFWKFPTVSMGLTSIMAIYQARFAGYLKNRGLVEENKQKVWAFLGDGEMDEPEAKGAITIATRDKLDNLIFVVDCNLQRLDGPVRGNHKIIQELEGIFKGAGWNVIKLLWGRDWDPLFEKDESNKLIQLLDELPDGEFQKMAYEGGEYIRENLFGKEESLKELVKNYSDDELKNLKRGGHDPVKIYNAFKMASEYTKGPTIILAQTIKGYGQGDGGEASNVAHQAKNLKKDVLKHFRDFFSVPVSDRELDEVPFLRPEDDSEEIKYLKERRKELGGYLPKNEDKSEALKEPDASAFKSFYEGSGEEEAATTMVMVQILGKLAKDEQIGNYIVPIIPDESRTFGMESLFSQLGIYAPQGQQYEPVDRGSLLYYKEAKDGAILEEGITEAGCMAEFIAAGTAYINHGLNMIPFYFFYSMFGFQRTADLIWAAADAGAKGFLIGGISGRTSLPGEGLQHLDGQSHLYAYAFPELKAYDPCFAYELAVITRRGIKEMFTDKKKLFYYITVGNQTYPMPEMPEAVEDGILRGMYRYRKSEKEKKRKVHLFGSGAIMQEVLRAASLLEEDYDASVDIWSITSYKALYDNAIDTERENRLKAQLNKEPSYIEQCLEKQEGVFVAACDYVKALPESVSQWFPGKLTSLGTDGYGRSASVGELRGFFEVGFKDIAYAALYDLTIQNKMRAGELKKAVEDLSIDPKKKNPRTS